jgi:hypothetical protein
MDTDPYGQVTEEQFDAVLDYMVKHRIIERSSLSYATVGFRANINLAELGLPFQGNGELAGRAFSHACSLVPRVIEENEEVLLASLPPEHVDQAAGRLEKVRARLINDDVRRNILFRIGLRDYSLEKAVTSLEVRLNQKDYRPIMYAARVGLLLEDSRLPEDTGEWYRLELTELQLEDLSKKLEKLLGDVRRANASLTGG